IMHRPAHRKSSLIGWPMYSTANGTNTQSVITSCMILSWPSDSTVKPMRLAGTWNMYSAAAISHDTSAAIHHGRVDRLRRCAYHANVMNTFEQVSSSALARAGWRSSVGNMDGVRDGR